MAKKVKEQARRRKRARRDLSAMAPDHLVRITRGIRGADPIEGFVVGLGDGWVLLARLADTIVLDGYVAVRLTDVVEVEDRGGPESFVGRALAIRGEWPPTPPPGTVPLDDVGPLLAAAAERSPLVTIHVERRYPEFCYIGRPVRIGRRVLRLHEILPDAEWEEGIGRYRLDDVTRIDWGGGYEEALHAVGGPPPTVADG